MSRNFYSIPTNVIVWLRTVAHSRRRYWDRYSSRRQHSDGSNRASDPPVLRPEKHQLPRKFIISFSSLRLSLSGLAWHFDCLPRDGLSLLNTIIFMIGIIVANVPEGLLATVTVIEANSTLINWLIDWLINYPLIDWLIDWMIDWLIDWSIDWLIDWLIDWVIDRLIDWLIDWVIDRLIDWMIDWMIDWLIDWLIGQLICYI